MALPGRFMRKRTRISLTHSYRLGAAWLEMAGTQRISSTLREAAVAPVPAVGAAVTRTT
jgi:hypothetical protein